MTELGRVASHFYIKHSSIVMYNDLLKRHMSEAEVRHQNPCLTLPGGGFLQWVDWLFQALLGMYAVGLVCACWCGCIVGCACQALCHVLITL